ncbi:3-deoxy-D-manno-octulosonic acid transferase [Limihaloglobus sulfuriphilus]|uniref:3-deoxy-D-manno-octulosonic acid transferase n=1 Tax=Limihaloglobus sulfuriphilus TaxID=1851148 RepID=A0A1Q2MBL2_9BACT|nr:3-deoxy-D-manno-octulosonic acid transferase [Limihaloglobus sulfuriphilus]AQQ70064.1 3-deoxy-D-manno-octulosonic acid transferase [Limihaloglobus sulfuriphilus]
MRYFLNIFYSIALVLYLPKVLYRRYVHGRYKDGLAHRFARFGTLPHRRGSVIWIHAVSVGEVNATRSLIKELRAMDAGLEFVITSTTDTGYARAKAVYKDDVDIFYFPFDFSWIMRRAFASIKPTVCVLMELEVWPNFIYTAGKNKVPVIVANGRISDNSYPTYRKLRWFVKRIFSNITIFCAQTEVYARRYLSLGGRDGTVVVTSSLKYDTVETDPLRVPGRNELTNEISYTPERPFLVAGGSGPGEEQMLLDVYESLYKINKKLRLAVVPRKPERFDEVAALIEKSPHSSMRYSALKNGKGSSGADIILVDTMGDLRKFYSIAHLVFVGRSLVPMGGSDMLEAAALKVFTTFGPHTFNFRQTVEVLTAGQGAVEAADSHELKAVLAKALQDDAYRNDTARRGQEIIISNQGASAKTAGIILDML